MSLNITTHKNILLKILKKIYIDTSLGPILGFKGGTCAYLFYNLPRFSVDLDFDLLDQAKEDDVLERVEKIISPYGKVKEVRKRRFNLFFLLSYADGARNVKIEINRRNFGSQYEIKTYLGISMLVMKKEDMAAHKLTAMYERIGRSSRDIFDVYFFLENNWPINEKIIGDRTNLSFSEFLKKSIKALEKVSNHEILSGQGELLDEKQKVWAKEHLKKDTLFLLRLKLEEKNSYNKMLLQRGRETKC